MKKMATTNLNCAWILLFVSLVKFHSDDDAGCCSSLLLSDAEIPEALDFFKQIIA